MNTDSVQSIALAYHAAGLNVLPISLDGSKAPIGKWQRWSTERQSQPPNVVGCGLGIVCGEPSGGLEVLDFDRAGVFDEWRAIVDSIDPTLVDRLPRVKTPNGQHVFLRSAQCARSQKLAMALESDGKKAGKVKIETRGQGGYVIAAGSPAEVHPSGVLYAVENGSLLAIPHVTTEEHNLLLSAARSLNEAVREAAPGPMPAKGGDQGKRPGDEFANRVSWSEILEPHGWTAVRSRGQVTHWRRPGKNDGGISATTGFCKDDLYVFSSNAEPFDHERCYNKFAAYALLNHGGDYSTAARALKDQGYGEAARRAPRNKAQRQASWDALTDPPPPTDNDAPPPAPPPPDDADAPIELKITAAELEPLLDDDPAAALKPDVFARILAVRSDDAEWQRILLLIRRKRGLSAFNAKLKRHEQARRRERASAQGWESQFLCRETKQGDWVKENIHSNYVVALTHDPAWRGVLALDEFSQEIVCLKAPPFRRSGTQWSDTDALAVKAWLEREHGFRPTTAAVHEAILAVASEARFNSLQDYLNGLEDDCDSNLLDTWLQRCFDCPDNEYVRQVGRKWLISAVARAFEPGCKVDTVLILEGGQGLRKSAVLKRLCPNPFWFVDGLSEFGSKDQASEIEGKWIVELAEMKGFGREQELIKAFITREAENYRPAYARHVVRSPRKCVFAATINPDNMGYLKDETGNRRYWPVKCGKRSPIIDAAFRDQLWAEAVRAYRDGEKWWFEDDDLLRQAEAEQEERLQLDPWHDTIADYCAGQRDVSTEEILQKVLGIERGRWSMAESRRVCSVLSRLRWQRYRASADPTGRRPWRFKRPGETEPLPLAPQPSNNVRAMFPS